MHGKAIEDYGNITENHGNSSQEGELEPKVHIQPLDFDEFLPMVKDDAVILSFKGGDTMRRYRVHIVLICDYRRLTINDAKFNMVADRGVNMVSTAQFPLKVLKKQSVLPSKSSLTCVHCAKFSFLDYSFYYKSCIKLNLII